MVEKNDNDSEKSGGKDNKNIILTVVAAILVVVIAVGLVTVSVFKGLKNEDNSTSGTTTEIVYKDALTFPETTFPDYFYSEPPSEIQSENQTITQSSDTQVNQAHTNTVEYITEGQSALPSTGNFDDVSKWSKARIVSEAMTAVNKTKRFTGNVSVNHKETFSANVTECTGGNIVKSIANSMVNSVVDPVDETLNFSGGNALNAEGEAVTILLPQKNTFSLSESGVASAYAEKTADGYILRLVLVEEKSGLYDIPRHNASSVGYLNVAEIDISFLEVDTADITYTGSAIELHINENGYVTYAEYGIPMHVEASAHRGSISGSAVFDGKQTEVWDFNW